MTDNIKELQRRNLCLKRALFKMIDQFMYTTKLDGVEYFDNYCESAGEAAFSQLDFEFDRIPKEEFYKRYDELNNELWKFNGNTDEYPISYLQYYLEHEKGK